MGSLIPGFAYDIFISYRQKDNKYDGWVSEFVDNLKKELEATFKEDISVYFDINPRDGLLETHDVDASLKEKLKCVIFIPIISRTYCDQKSFAWEHEFKPFVEIASNDQFGLRVRLKDGNVSCRVLPVRIHELESSDTKICEKLLEGELRGVDFIYKSAGVNRPLRTHEDHPHDNLNKIFYRDQINKTANAINEIIRSIADTKLTPVKETDLPEKCEPENLTGIFDSYKTLNTKYGLRKVYDAQQKGISGTYNLKKFLDPGHRKYFLTILLLAPLVAFILNWKGLTNLIGRGNTKKELARIHVGNAVRYFDSGMFDQAKSEADLALTNNPDNSAAWTTLAAVSVKQGDLNKAIIQTLEAIKIDPSNGNAAYNLAFAFEDKQDYHQAMEWYSKAIKADSSLVPAYSALGRLYNKLNQTADAVLILEIAIDKYPDSEYNYLIYKNLGNTYLLMGITGEAIKYLEFSTGIRQNEPETNLYLAKAYEAAGEVTKSIDSWQKYIDLETDTLKASEARKHLKEITVEHLRGILK